MRRDEWRTAMPRDAVWRAFDANEITHSAAHYLLAVARLSAAGGTPRAADVARFLGVSRAAVSLQLRALQQQGLVAVGGGQVLRVTTAGADLAARVTSKRTVIRTLLAEVLGVTPEVAETDACKAEHLLSGEAAAALVGFLHFLSSDHPAARACLAAYRSSKASCPTNGRCELCQRVCLLAGEDERQDQRKTTRAKRRLPA